MRLVHNILLGIALAGLLFAASCNLFGSLDDEEIPLNLPHDEGGGGDV
jgi:hypothetical protein